MGVDDAGIDMLSVDIDLFGIGRDRDACSEGSDLSFIEKNCGVFKHIAADGVNCASDERNGLLLLRGRYGV